MIWRPSFRFLGALVSAVLLTVGATPSWAAISWVGGNGTSPNSWFNPGNWSQSANNLLPPVQLTAGVPTTTDAQINNGWNNTGEGVVYDPVGDATLFAAAASLTYTTDSALAANYGNFGPEHIYRLYISRNTTNKNVLTIKSGDLIIDSTTIIGRSGSTVSAANEGRVVQSGGRLRLPLTNLELGNSETAGWGNGVYEYRGGILEVAMDGQVGIRVGNGTSTGPSGVNRFIMGNSATGGRVRTWDFANISYRGTADATFTEGADPNGTTRGVAINEFRYSNGGTRPIQVLRNLTINNGTEAATGAKLSTRLELKLDSAPTVLSGVPQNLGLFDVDSDNSGDGVINGFGDLNGDATVNSADQIFAKADGLSHYAEGSEIFADLGATRYVWNISYTGNISWSDYDNSVVSEITGAGTGRDVVLMGLRTENLVVGVPGDFNNDTVVNAADYTTYRDNVGSATPLPNDGGLGAPIGPGHYTLWKNAFQPGAAVVSSSAVPEPAAGLVLALVAAGGWLRRRR